MTPFMNIGWGWTGIGSIQQNKHWFSYTEKTVNKASLSMHCKFVLENNPKKINKKITERYRENKKKGDRIHMKKGIKCKMKRNYKACKQKIKSMTLGGSRCNQRLRCNQRVRYTCSINSKLHVSKRETTCKQKRSYI